MQYIIIFSSRAKSYSQRQVSQAPIDQNFTQYKNNLYYLLSHLRAPRTNKIDDDRSWNRSVTFTKRSAILIPVQQGKPLTKLVAQREITRENRASPRSRGRAKVWKRTIVVWNVSFHLILRAPVHIHQVKMFCKVFNNYWMWVFEGVNWGPPQRKVGFRGFWAMD